MTIVRLKNAKKSLSLGPWTLDLRTSGPQFGPFLK